MAVHPTHGRLSSKRAPPWHAVPTSWGEGVSPSTLGPLPLPPPATAGLRLLGPRPRLVSAPAPEPRPPPRPKGALDDSPTRRGPPQPRASPLTWQRAPGPPSLGDQSRSPGPSRRHLEPTPSALRLRSASRTCDLKGAGQHPSRAAGQNSTDPDASPLKDQRAGPP